MSNAALRIERESVDGRRRRRGGMMMRSGGFIASGRLGRMVKYMHMMLLAPGPQNEWRSKAKYIIAAMGY